jgi:hypothetical protein
MHDPYAPPTALLDEEPEIQMTDAEAEALRRTHFTHESRLYSVGTFMMLGTLNLFIGPMRLLNALSNISSGLAGAVAGQEGLLNVALPLIDGLYITGMGLLCLHGGLNLRDLNPKPRTVYTIVACLWVLSLSFYSLLGLWALFLIHSPVGKIVLSPRYQEARHRTPEIQNQTSLLTWLVYLLLFVAVVLVAFNKRLG